MFSCSDGLALYQLSRSHHMQINLQFFFLSGFCFTNIHESQDFKGRGRAFHLLLITTSNRFTDTETLAGRLLQRAHLCTQLTAGLEAGTFGFRAQVSNKFAISLQDLKKEVRNGVHFLHADKRQSFLKVYFNTLGIKVSYKVDIIIITGHDQAFFNYSK